jgi:hypothetical protein
MCARPMIYLSAAEMDAFVLEATESIQKIYCTLWPVPPALDHHHTSLDFSNS